MKPHHSVDSTACQHQVPPAYPNRPLRVGLLGLGTVGGGTYRVLQRNAQPIADRAGRRIEVAMVAVRDVARAAAHIGQDVPLTDDPFELVHHPDVDVIVEAIGGVTIARELVLQAIAAGKHVVTANKALLALHGTEVFAAARARGVMLAYEGAVAVSIPIIKALREGLAANRIQWVAGIINGTTNFILSEMHSQGLDFAAALQAAQRKGYAEQDPAFDVDGIDAAHKLTLLASNAFGIALQFDAVHVEGIRSVAPRDMQCAQRLGYCIKLLGVAQCVDHAISLRVQPVWIAQDHLLAHVHGAMNAVMVQSDAAGLTLYYGAGAGAEPTASAVIADLVDVSRSLDCAPQHRVPYLAFQDTALAARPMVAAGDVCTPYAVRIELGNASQAAPELEALCGSVGVRVVRQEYVTDPDRSDTASLVWVTAPTTGYRIGALTAALERLVGGAGAVRAMRIEHLG